jgi:hypothetical protein
MHWPHREMTDIQGRDIEVCYAPDDGSFQVAAPLEAFASRSLVICSAQQAPEPGPGSVRGTAPRPGPA